MSRDALPAEPVGATVFVLPVTDSPRARHYMTLFDRSVALVLDGFDVDKGLIRHDVPEGSPGVGPEVALLDRFERKRHISPLNQWAYRVGRTSASNIGTLAYAYAQPLSRYYRDPQILRAVWNGFEAFIERQDASGESVFTPIRYSSVYGTHEMAWRLECFITAFFCVRDDLTPEQRGRYWEFLNRAMRFLQRTPCDHPCNRGIVWTAVMAMCWRATGYESYLHDAREMWRLVGHHVFHDSGQVNEGPGPDIVYSPISYEYLVRYRMMTDDASLDPIIRRSTDWLAEMYTDTFEPFQGASTRHDRADTSHKAVQMLMGFELLVDTAPHYSDMADSLLAHCRERVPAAAAHHGSITWITAAATHDPAKSARGAGVPRPSWVHRYSTDATEYFTLGQPGYQAMISLRGIPEKKGVQTWAVRGQHPFIFPEGRRVSTVRAWGFDLAARDVTKDDEVRWDRSDISTVTASHGDLLVTYLIAPETMVIVHTFAREEDRETVWVTTARQGEGFEIHGDRATARGTGGSLHWLGPRPSQGEDASQVRFRSSAVTQVYALASGRFAWGQQSSPGGEGSLVEWDDGSGRYLALVNHRNRSVSVSVRCADCGEETVTLLPGEAWVRRRGPG